MESLEKFKKKIKNYWIILIVCFFGLISSLFLSFYLHDKWSDFFVNLSASFIIIIFTIFIIDQLLEKRQLARFRDAHSVAKEDLEILGNMLISYMSAPFGFNISLYDYDDKIAISTILNQMLKIDFNKKLDNLSKYKREHLLLSLISIKDSLNSKISLYSDLLPPEILGKLLIVNKNFSSLNFMFGVYIICIENKNDNQIIVTNSLATNFKNYFLAVEQFLISLEKWKR